VPTTILAESNLLEPTLVQYQYTTTI